MKYQLALQLPASSIRDYDEMIRLEQAIHAGLGELGEVDGHDAGSGEMNMFVLTNEPRLAFERIMVLLETRGFVRELRAAYREIGMNDFTIIYPAGLTCFAIA